MGRISQVLLDKIVRAVKQQTGVLLWKNTMAVIDWFQGTPDKQLCSFVCFDVVEFYPSITEVLMRQALTFAEQYIDISQSDIDIIMHSRRSLLFVDGKAWVKLNKSANFDVQYRLNDSLDLTRPNQNKTKNLVVESALSFSSGS